MKTRIISAVIAIPFGVLIVALNNINVYRFVVAVLSAVAVFELLLTMKYLKYKTVCAVSLLFSFSVPYAFSVDVLLDYKVLFCLLYLLIIFTVMIADYKSISFTVITSAAFCSFFIPFSLSAVLFSFRDFGEHAAFVILFILISAWTGDAGAYFVGTFIGKHKMAPEISPKKTWEGFAGGVVTSGIIAVILTYGYAVYIRMFSDTAAIKADVAFILIIAVASSVLGVAGDLTASVLKRQFMVKDFGNVMPGHGGVLDRFDSVLFVAPFVYFAFKIYFPIVIL